MADALATSAVACVKSGMIVGLGTGRAAARAIDALGARVVADRLRIRCVATSVASFEQGGALGLRMLPFDDLATIDYLFDGADEVDDRLRMIKGRGGAMTREKVVARAAARRVYLVQQSKVVQRLGVAAPLPIEILPFGLGATREALSRLGLEGVMRTKADGSQYKTDNGCPVLDAALGGNTRAPVHLDSLRAALDAVPGVVGHGLFLTEADEVIVEDEAGNIRAMTRG